MKRIAYLAAATALLLAVSCGKENNNPQEQIKTGDPVATVKAAEVTMNSAILHGCVSTEYLHAGGESGFIVSTSATPSLENGQKVVSSEVDKNGKFFVQVSGLASSTLYYYKAYLDTGTENLVGNVKLFVTKDFEYVPIDLGLSVKWANANLGAKDPEYYGDFYSWGETEIKEKYSWETYKWCIPDFYLKLTRYNTSSSEGTIDNITTLDAADDVAHVKLGGKWRMPTSSEVDELIATLNNSSYLWEWKSINGHNGWLVTYLVNNNSIFLPAAGYRVGTGFNHVGSYCAYWSSSLNTEFPVFAWCVYYDSVSVFKSDGPRSCGLPVRPVSK